MKKKDMEPRESDQHSVPGNNPDRETPEPHLPGEESEDIRKGAQQEDQLGKLQPEEGEENKVRPVGSPPNTTVDDGE